MTIRLHYPMEVNSRFPLYNLLIRNMLNNFKLWFEYDQHANRAVLETISNNIAQIPDDTLKLFSHIIAAHDIWNCRILNIKSGLRVWEIIAVNDMQNWILKNLENTKEITLGMQNSEIINYQNSSGKRFSNSIPDILFHVLTHSHYHRGQIARNLRENNIEPPETNYITFRR